jgi:TonB family protein
MKRVLCAVGILGVLAGAPGFAQTPDVAQGGASNGKTIGRETYPAESILNKEQGATLLSMCVETDGRITNVKVVKSSGHARLDRQSVESIKRQRMTPAKDAQGKPVRVCDHKMTLEWKIG